jgi:2,4-dichlorophenol 6-monooxygenase
VPHVWVHSDRGDKASTLDLTGHGRFTVLTGIGGQGWLDAAKAVGKELGIDITGHLIGPRQPWQDFSGDWARAREIRDSGVLLVRPDQHVAWRKDTISSDPTADLRQALTSILDR